LNDGQHYDRVMVRNPFFERGLVQDRA